MRFAVLSATSLSVLVLIGTSSSVAQLESLALANDLGDVLASEEVCGLSYKPVAIERFIAEKVKAEDMGFTNALNTMTRGKRRQFQEMSASQKTAHCTQIRRVARSYGFID
jgi:hypothetical protein